MFALGICTYTNEMKTAILHVPESTLHTYTAVSPQTAIAMANGVAALSHADFALSVTGYAGPGGGTSEHPVGTVFWVLRIMALHLPCICRLTGWAFLLEKVSGKERQSVHLALQGKF